MSPASLSPLPNKNHVPATLIQLQQVKVLGGWDYKLLHPLDHSCFVALCGWCVAFQTFDLSRETGSNFFYHLQMDTNTQIAHSHACKTLSSLLSFFVLTLNIQLSSTQFISRQSVLTYSQPTGEVSHDTLWCWHQKYLTLFTLGVFTCVNLSSFPCLPFTYTLSGAPAVLIGDTDTWLLHLLFLQIWLFCCNVYSYSPPVSTQLCVNVTLPQSFFLGAANLEFDQLCCQWNITQIQHNNKS